MTNGRSGDGAVNRLKLALGAAALWTALLAGWFLLVDTFSFAELGAGIVAATAGATAAALAYEQGILRQRPTAHALGGIARALARVPADLTLLARELIRALASRHREGRLHAIEVSVPSSAAGDTRRAAIELIGSIAPNTIVLGVDEQRMIVHQLVERAEQRQRLRQVRP